MKFTTGAVLAFLVSSVAGTPTGSHTPSKRPKGIVYTDGQKFRVDGKPYLYAGTNAYWLPFLENPDDLHKTFRDAQKAGLKVFRTWGFNDKNETFVPGGLPQYGGEGAGAAPVYFQSWAKGKPTINYGKNGLQAFDNVVRVAALYDIKLLVAFTNNWADYGGMDVYTINLGGKYHDDFYTKATIKSAFKKYIKAFITRYKDNPTIFAWEIANEPRCGADGKRNLPRSDKCDIHTLTNWIKEIARYIKSVDKKHLVTTGGEGGFYIPGDEDWAYNGADGGDFYGETELKDIDFGTFHLYPDWWSKTVEWSNKWIVDHGKAQQALNKPVVFEEYGWLHDAERLAWLGKVAAPNETRVNVISKWQELSLKYRMPDHYWQYGVCGLSRGCNHDDGFTIYNNNTVESKPLIYDHAKEVNKVNSRLS